MQSYTSLLCKRCRSASLRQFHSSLPTGRSTKPVKAYRKGIEGVNQVLSRSPNAYTWKPSNASQSKASPVNAPPRALTPQRIRSILRLNLSRWIEATETCHRLTSLGLEEDEARAVLNAYEIYLEDELSPTKGSPYSEGDKDPWGVSYLSTDDILDRSAFVNRALTARLFAFASQPGLEIGGVRTESLQALRQVYETLDLRFPAETFTLARFRTRKVYLHVGPTNSGKTYNALRALASARSGVYAGPLRLLAHEVWERLNRGSIRPYDADPATAHLYARECNLVTGEEQRIVSPDANLTSCTVEMINMFKRWNVCVIDEIQMIADPNRGNAWTAAVLGVNADELHLCGEEAAIPLVQALMAETRDELIIKHYERLTPLTVAEKSLEGRWNCVDKGDCVVTFSRSSIFALKRIVEKSTGLRCAVAYGRLPPETRSEQAALFNDRNSGYDVMVATDAIGMGLNLKIKRVVFVELTKYNGERDVPLSLSQIKQIGGRAGRFGEHGDASSSGIVTCLHAKDLPVLTKAFAMQSPVLRRATVPLHLSVLSRIAQLLPDSVGLKDLNSLLRVAARLGDNYSLHHDVNSWKGMEIIDDLGKTLRLVEKVQFIQSPTSWRSQLEVDVFSHYLRQYVAGGTVDVKKSLQESGLLQTLEKVNECRSTHQEANPKSQLGVARGYKVQTMETLAELETLHRVLIAYIWLSFRMPVSFNQHIDAIRLKEEVEAGIEFILEGIENVKRRREVKSLSRLRAERSDQKIHYVPKNANVPLKIRQADLA